MKPELSLCMPVLSLAIFFMDLTSFVLVEMELSFHAFEVFTPSREYFLTFEIKLLLFLNCKFR